MAAHQLRAEQVDRLFEEQPGRWVARRLLLAQEREDVSHPRIVETDAVQQIDRFPPGQRLGAFVKTLGGQIDVTDIDHAVDVPAPVMPRWNDDDRTRPGLRADAQAVAGPQIDLGAPVVMRDDHMRRHAGKHIVQGAVRPSAGQARIAAESFGQGDRRPIEDAAHFLERPRWRCGNACGGDGTHRVSPSDLGQRLVSLAERSPAAPNTAILRQSPQAADGGRRRGCVDPGNRKRDSSRPGSKGDDHDQHQNRPP
jgi:hypothetical protein